MSKIISKAINMKKYIINYSGKGISGTEIILLEGDQDDAIAQLWGKIRGRGVHIPPVRCAEVIDIQAA